MNGTYYPNPTFPNNMTNFAPEQEVSTNTLPMEQSGSTFEGFDFGSFGSGGGFSSFFRDLFGQGARSKFTGGFNAERNSGEMNANVNIDLYTALLGGEVIIQLSSGQKLKLKIKPGTQPGTKARLRGKGYDRGDGSFGDLIITYNVKLPTSLSEKQKELLQQMRNS